MEECDFDCERHGGPHACMCPPLLDLTDLDRHALKELAFMYHYGAWRSAEEAKKSISGQAAAEMARRGGYEMPAPMLLPCPEKN